ncbi:hypothetical protein EGR_10259 [Echinococcus granulosus]|uniref:Uncharacterized protein n=1 Tax=Echinococcus granulosus TaxID=6210 RepID=W6UMZ1_ECHGR|nr:hypothetical protein EGR_10259 [Echinococcus granulosus]EUB54884.1 hypothetical protein EGR_10259 [Echinococcus granulosus]
MQLFTPLYIRTIFHNRSHLYVYVPNLAKKHLKFRNKPKFTNLRFMKSFKIIYKWKNSQIYNTHSYNFIGMYLYIHVLKLSKFEIHNVIYFYVQA